MRKAFAISSVVRPAHLAQGEGDARFRRQGGMTAREDQAQPIVLERVRFAGPFRRAPLRFEMPHELVLRRIEPRPSTEGIDGSESSRRDQPGSRVAGHSTARPHAQRRRKSFVHGLLGKIKIPEQADQRGPDSSRIHAIQGVEQCAYLLGGSLRHDEDVSKPAGPGTSADSPGRGRRKPGGVKWWRRRGLNPPEAYGRGRSTLASSSAGGSEEAIRSAGGGFLREGNGDRVRPDSRLHPLGHQPELVAPAVGARPIPDAEGDQAVETERGLIFPDHLPEPRPGTRLGLGRSQPVRTITDTHGRLLCSELLDADHPGTDPGRKRQGYRVFLFQRTGPGGASTVQNWAKRCQCTCSPRSAKLAEPHIPTRFALVPPPGEERREGVQGRPNARTRKTVRLSAAHRTLWTVGQRRHAARCRHAGIGEVFDPAREREARSARREDRPTEEDLHRGVAQRGPSRCRSPRDDGRRHGQKLEKIKAKMFRPDRVGMKWWRRRELNPRPEALRERPLHAQPLLISRPAASRRGKTAAGQPRIDFAAPSGGPEPLHPHFATSDAARRVRYASNEAT